MKRKSISKKNFLNAVTHEINAIKENATSEELNRLNIYLFNPDEKQNCIYGQLTTSCDSPRAKHLMELSCIKVFNVECVDQLLDDYFENIAYDTKVEKNKNQTWIADFIEETKFIRDLDYLSALETYIMLNHANNYNIIKYLKGETTELNLDTIK